jgi:hypothetical protein
MLWAFAMEPAYDLVLTQDEHALIGEAVEIMGRADEIMLQMIARLRGMDRQKAAKIVAKGVKEKARELRNAIRYHSSDSEILRVADLAAKEMKTVAVLRNAFIHALFEGDYVEPGYVEPGYQTTSATHIRSQETKAVSDLSALREDAALLSCLMAHLVPGIVNSRYGAARRCYDSCFNDGGY